MKTWKSPKIRRAARRGGVRLSIYWNRMFGKERLNSHSGMIKSTESGE
jgi:hypothetical protein